MKIALIHESFEMSKYHRVIEEMRVLGPPVIRAMWCEDRGFWVALEGCHRVRAAAKLGLTPIINPVEYRRGMSWLEAGMRHEHNNFAISIDDVWDSAGKEMVIGFGEDGPPPLPEYIGPPGPGEVMIYEIIKDIGFDFGNGIVSGVGTRFSSDDTNGKDVTDYVSMRYLRIVDEPDVPRPEKTAEANAAPRRSGVRVGRRGGLPA